MVTLIIGLIVALVGSVCAFFVQKNKTDDVEAQNNNLKTNDEVAQFTQDIVENEKIIKENSINEDEIEQSIKKISVLKDSAASLIEFFNKRK